MTRLADLAAVIYLALLTLSVAAELGAAAIVAWAVCASWLVYRKAAGW